MNECAAKNVACTFRERVGHFERTCRAKKNNRGRWSVRMIQGQERQELFKPDKMEVDASQHESSVG